MTQFIVRNAIGKNAHPGSLSGANLFRPMLFVLMFILSAGLAVGSVQLEAADKVGADVAAAVNINTADAATLAAQLNGVGQSRAEEIVRYRETYGKFASVEELTEVKGVGESTLEKNRHLITLE